jgi:hypothetical protein
MVLRRARPAYRELLLLWMGVVTGPLAWLAELETSYLLTNWVCGHGRGWLLSVVNAAALLVAGAGAMAAWRARRYLASSGPQAPAPTADCRSFLVAMGLALSGLFALAILASIVPTAMLSPCAL